MTVKINGKPGLKKLLCAAMVLILAVLPLSVAASAAANTNEPFIFVSGYAGWGQYSEINDTF